MVICCPDITNAEEKRTAKRIDLRWMIIGVNLNPVR
jgi:hypothetical protein